MNNEHENDGFTPKAPAGGAISNVNGQFYEGGEFMPTTGLACGLVRRARKYADVTPGPWRTITITRQGFVTANPVGSGRETYLSPKPLTRPEAEAFVAEVLRLRDDSYRARNLVPHPTRLVIEG